MKAEAQRFLNSKYRAVTEDFRSLPSKNMCELKRQMGHFRD